MRRSTALRSRLRAQSMAGKSLSFDNCIGGYFSTDPDYALRVEGRTEIVEGGKNLFPLGDLLNQNSWSEVNGNGIMDPEAVEVMLEPRKTYTISFDAECIWLPDAEIECEFGCGALPLNLYNDALGFILVPTDAIGSEALWGYNIGLPEASTYPVIDLFVNYRIGLGEKHHGVVTFATPESISGYKMQVLTNRYGYDHVNHPELCNATVSFTNIKIEEGETATPDGYEKCVRAGSVIVCGNVRATVPCDLYNGDVWYPATGIVELSGGERAEYPPCDLKASVGKFDVYQEPVELEAHLSATLLAKKMGNALSWRDIQSIVRCGLADKYFKIGDQFTVDRNGETLVFDVIGIDHDTPTDKSLKHSMTLQLHTAGSYFVFNGKEAFYYAGDGLNAGTYNFRVVNQPWCSSDNGKSFQFTLTKPIPAGGQIFISADYNATLEGKSVKTYSSGSSVAEIESTTVTAGSDGVSLGATDGTVDGVNHIQRIVMGSNEWKTSEARQYINSEASAGKVWKPMSKFDRPPEWVDTANGFLFGMDEEFLSVVGEVDKITERNNVTDGGGTETMAERFFLLSCSEVYGGDYNGNGMSEGKAYPYYADNSDMTSAGTGADTNRIKYRNDGVAMNWWLRTPHASFASRELMITAEGKFNTGFCNGNAQLFPACCIV